MGTIFKLDYACTYNQAYFLTTIFCKAHHEEYSISPETNNRRTRKCFIVQVLRLFKTFPHNLPVLLSSYFSIDVMLSANNSLLWLRSQTCTANFKCHYWIMFRLFCSFRQQIYNISFRFQSKTSCFKISFLTKFLSWVQTSENWWRQIRAITREGRAFQCNFQ